MTVAELIVLLSEYDMDDEVEIESSYADYSPQDIEVIKQGENGIVLCCGSACSPVHGNILWSLT